MIELPEINDRVDIEAGGQWLPSRVEDRDGEDLYLAEPGDVEARSGQQIAIRWVTSRGVAEVPAVYQGQAARAVPVWRIRPAAPPEIRQRRRFVRARAFLHVDIEFEEGLGLQRIAASSIDISEGGIQVVTLGTDEIAVGRSVVVAVELDDELVRVAGDVIQSRVRPDGSHAVVVRFVGVRSGDADRIRKYVFRTQLDSLSKDAR